ncbi:TonB-dependent receptor [Methylomonas sp. ZR1]|uniref:TonB-dependent siderophore receptor n=1 Tax=Methylomonas sp. ZR1 TaxID=1797072 RepID=UPI0014932461|nr:TonB-dependent receptor [Methylomonas sp. ZR1]NOV31637.1 TonB-dependent receptor [Methylomonas sp. ZR1]
MASYPFRNAHRKGKPTQYNRWPLSLTIAAVLSTPAVMAAEQNIAFDIPAQSLSGALNAFADTANVQLSYPAEMTAGLKSPGVSGQLTVRQALQKLLAGTGVVAGATGNGTITLQRAPDSHNDVSTLSAVTVSGNRTRNNAADPYSKDYVVTKSFAATKTDTPLMENPTSVQVVSRAVMDDQKTTKVKDALENVSGVRANPSLGGGVGFIVRGFRNNNIYRNGLMASEAFFGDFDAANLENIEVIKGPAQLYGRTEPGGMINLTTKRGLDTAYYSLEQQFGNYDHYRTQWDAGGPLTSDKSLVYRFSGAYQSNGSFRDFVSVDRMVFNPSVTWRPSDDTDVTVDIEGTDKTAPADFGIPFIGNRPASIPISRNLGDPNTPNGEQSGVKIGSEINHRFNDDWAIHNRFLASLAEGGTTFVNPGPAFDAAAALNQTTGLMQRNIFRQITDQEHYATNLDLTGKFQTGALKHDVLVGFDFYRTFNKYGGDGRWKSANPALAINIYDPYPSYGISQSTFNSAFATTGDTFGTAANGGIGNRASIYNSWYGVYFQDQITFWDKLHIMGGGRYDWTETGRGNGFDFATAESRINQFKREDQGFSPKVGILYEAMDELSLYGNWTTSFGANNAPAADGRSFDPQIGEQFEVGLKTQLFDQRLLATLAYFHLEKDNILVANNATPDPFDRIANLQRSQGIELDATGYLTDKFSLIGSYAFTDARIIKDYSGGTQGNRMSNVPEHSGSLWLRYDMNGYAAKDGLSAGFGGVAAGQREGDNTNTFQMPGYVRLDAFLAYKQKVGGSRITAQFNIRNLLDKEYYESTDPDSNVAPALGVYPGAPLTAIGSIRVEY